MHRFFSSGLPPGRIVRRVRETRPLQVPPLRVEAVRAQEEPIPNRMSLHRLPVEQLRRRDPAPRERVPRLAPLRQRDARPPRTTALHDRPLATLDLDARGPRGAWSPPGPGARSAQQLRPRRAAGPHQRHQPVAVRPVHGPVPGRRGRRAVGRTGAAQRPYERELHRACARPSTEPSPTPRRMWATTWAPARSSPC